MLVLTRTAGEAIIIETNGVRIRVLVKHIKGKRVSLGFQGPADCHVLREELALQSQSVCKAAQGEPTAPVTPPGESQVL